MQYETKDLSGSLFKNERKREGKQDADYQGRCKIAGVEFYISAWLNTSKSGAKYMGLKFKEVEAKPTDKHVAKAQEPEPEPEINDEIPF